MESHRVAIIVDHPLRDLPGLVLLGLELCRRGHSVYLVPMYCNEELYFMAPDMVMLNYLRKVSGHLARELVERDIPFGVIDTEGGPVADPDCHAQYWLEDGNLRKRAKLYCLWGERLRPLVQEWFPSTKVVATGCPRFDLYVPPWRDASAALGRELNPPTKPYVVVASKFALVNSAFGSYEGVLDSLVNKYGYKMEVAVKMLEDEKRQQDLYLELVYALASRMPEVNFVYRPHPFESAVAYQEKFAPYPNVVVEKQGAIIYWLAGAAAIVHLDCTTCFDGTIAAVPAITPGWIGTDQPTILPEMLVGEQARDVDHAQALIEAAVRGDFSMSARNKAVWENQIRPEWFFKTDGKNHLRVADEIEDVLKEGSGAGVVHQKLMASGLGARQASNDLKGMLINIMLEAAGYSHGWNARNFREKRAWIKKYERSEKFFSPEEVQKIIDHVQAAGVSEETWGEMRVKASWAFAPRGKTKGTGRGTRSILLCQES